MASKTAVGIWIAVWVTPTPAKSKGEGSVVSHSMKAVKFKVGPQRVISLMLVLAMILCPAVPIIAISPTGYSDVENHWAKTALTAAISNGLLVGSGNSIRPEDDLKRAEMAAMINQAFGAKDKADISGFTDIAPGQWYVDVFAKAVKMGTFKGSGSRMYPERSISRQEAFTVIAQAFKLSSTDFSLLNRFSDNDQIEAWAKPGVAALVAGGYVNGSGGRINPNAGMSRAEFAQLIYNLVKTYIREAGTYTSVAEGNVIVNVPGVTLKGITIKGDLILGDGIGGGEVKLDGVTMQGRIVARGGAKTVDVTTAKTTSSSTSGSRGGGGGEGNSNPLVNGHTGSYIVSNAGTYGPSSGTATVTGNLTVNTSGAILKNLVVTGDLVLGAGLGNGDATLNNVTVEGDTIVNGGGSNSIHITGATNLGIIVIDDQRTEQTEPINISAEGTGTIEAVNIISQTAVKVTPVTDTIGYVAATDGSTVTYGDTDYTDELLDKIVLKADSILDAAIVGSTDSDKTINPALSSMTADIVDFGQWGVWGLKYYINPLDGVAGYASEYERLEAKLIAKGQDTSLIDLRDHPEQFVPTMYDRWFPGQPNLPPFGLNQGMLNSMWDTYSRFVALNQYSIDGSGAVTYIGTGTSNATFISTAEALYDKLDQLQGYSVINDISFIDNGTQGVIEPGDMVQIIFTRRLVPGDSTKGQDKISSLITAETSTFGTGAAVEWGTQNLNFFESGSFAVSKGTITLGTSSDLMDKTFTIPKSNLGSYIPDGFVEVRGQYGEYITDLEPLFDVDIVFSSSMMPLAVERVSVVDVTKFIGHGPDPVVGDKVVIQFNKALGHDQMDDIALAIAANGGLFGIPTGSYANYTQVPGMSWSDDDTTMTITLQNAPTLDFTTDNTIQFTGDDVTINQTVTGFTDGVASFSATPSGSDVYDLTVTFINVNDNVGNSYLLNGLVLATGQPVDLGSSSGTTLKINGVARGLLESGFTLLDDLTSCGVGFGLQMPPA